jgi:protein JSN1
VGPIRIGYARVPTKTPIIGGPEIDPDLARSPERFGEALSSIQGAAAVPTQQQLSPSGGGVENYRSPLVIDLVKAGVHEQVLQQGLASDGVVSEEQMIMQVLSAGQPGTASAEDVRAAAEANRPVGMYYSSIPPMGDQSTGQPFKRFDVLRLKDLRKRLESAMMSQGEVDEMALELIEDTAEVSPDL